MRLNKSTARLCRRYDEQTRGRRFPFLCKFPYVCLKKVIFLLPSPPRYQRWTNIARSFFFLAKFTNKFYIEVLCDKRVTLWMGLYIFESILAHFASRCLFHRFFILLIFCFPKEKKKTFLQTKLTIIKYLFILMPTQRIMTTTTCTTKCMCVIWERKSIIIAKKCVC